MRASSETAVSSVVGTVLMLGLTVTIFAGVGIFAISAVQEDEAPARADVQATRSGSALLMEHLGGEPVILEQGRLLANVDGEEQEFSLEELQAALGDTRWHAGQTICVAGTDAGCLVQGQDVLGIVLVTQNAVVLEEGERAGSGAAAGSLPDLSVEILSSSPASPVESDAVTFTARVTNNGPAVLPSSSIAVRFEVGAVLVGDVSTTTDLAVGATVDLTSSAWTAVQGSHTVTATVDPAAAIAESNEANNDDTFALTVAANPADPGFPFHDIDCDGLYDPATDDALDASDVTDGDHDAGPECLVIPASVGPIVANEVDFHSDDMIIINVDLTATGNGKKIHVHGDGPITVAGITMTSQHKIEIKGDHVDITGSTLDADGNNIDIDADGGLSGAGANLQVQNKIDIDVTGDADFAGATLGADTNNVELDVSGDLDLTGATIDAQNKLDIDADHLIMDGTTVTTGANNLEIDVTSMSAVGAFWGIDNKVDIDATGAVDLTSLVATVSQNNFEVHTDGLLTLTSSILEVDNRILLRPDGGLTAPNAALTASQHEIDVETQNGHIDLAAATLTTEGGSHDIDLDVKQPGYDIDVEGATLDADGDILLTVDSVADEVRVQDAIFRDANNLADVTPNGAATGTPAEGGIE